MLNKSRGEKVRYAYASPRRKKQDTEILGLGQEEKQISRSKPFSKYKIYVICTCKLSFCFVFVVILYRKLKLIR